VSADNAYGSGTDWQYQSYFFDKYNQTLRHATLWSAFGNHDRYKSSALTQSGPYFTAFNMPKHGQAGGGRSGTSAYYRLVLSCVERGSVGYAPQILSCIGTYGGDVIIDG
jgi:hypothetical protein